MSKNDPSEGNDLSWLGKAEHDPTKNLIAHVDAALRGKKRLHRPPSKEPSTAEVGFLAAPILHSASIPLDETGFTKSEPTPLPDEGDIRAVIEHIPQATASAIAAIAPKGKVARKGKKWLPTDREKAILKIPRNVELEDYCRELDEAELAIPATWRSLPGAPLTYADVLNMKQGRKLITTDRNNVWTRQKKQSQQTISERL